GARQHRRVTSGKGAGEHSIPDGGTSPPASLERDRRHEGGQVFAGRQAIGQRERLVGSGVGGELDGPGERVEPRRRHGGRPRPRGGGRRRGGGAGVEIGRAHV